MNAWPNIIISLIVVAIASAPTVLAQKESPLETELRVNAVAHGNFFQAPDGFDRENVQAALAQARLTYGLGEQRLSEVFGYVGFTSYGQFNSSPSFTGGIAHDDGVHDGGVSVTFELNRPQVDVGDELDTSDTIGFVGEYSYRVSRDWEASAVFQFRDQSFELRPLNDNQLVGPGVAVRYRGFGYKFSPEVGARWAGRSAVDANQDMSQRDIFLRLRFLPRPPLYISTRIRKRHRDYSIPDVRQSNFNRKDDRLQWTVTVNYRFTDHVAVNLYYAYTNADSTRVRRVFTRTFLSVGFAYAF